MTKNEAKILQIINLRLGPLKGKFQESELLEFVQISGDAFNAVPLDSDYDFKNCEDGDDAAMYNHLIAQYALYLAFSTLAISEKTKEVSVTDNGITATPPALSELLYQTAFDEYERWVGMVNGIKSAEIQALMNHLAHNLDGDDYDDETN